MQKVDVIINLYGKPWQTLCALKSLMKHSGNHIDKIYVTEEKFHPYNDEISWILDRFDNLVHFIPKEYYFARGTSGDMSDKENRYVYRYQYGIENSDKDFVFIMHNDILFTGDIVGDMLSGINGTAGIGLIGQCWNCPAFKSGQCDGDRHRKYNPSYEEVIELFQNHPPARHQYGFINKEQPMPLPECRLNEFACLIKRDITIKECHPNGNSPLFGSYDMLDLGDAWFRSLIEGYDFKQYDINKTSDHGYFSKIEPRFYTSKDKFFVSGYPTQLNPEAYWKAEQAAKEYYELNFKE